jgi:hypothetical protein
MYTVAIAILCWLIAAPLSAQVISSEIRGTGRGDPIVYVKGVSIATANTDRSVLIVGLPSGARYVVRRIVVTNASVNLSTSKATLGVFTGAGGTGTTISAAALLTTLTAVTKFSDRTLAVLTDTQNALTLYVRTVAAHGSTATVDVYIFGDVLP